MALNFLQKLGQYNSEYRRLKEPAGDFSTALLNIGADYYYSNLNWNLNSDNNPVSNKNIRIDNWRPDIGPRIINVDKDTSSYLVGLRGQTDSGWDWETAF